MTVPSVDDEEPRSAARTRAMRFRAVSHVIAHAWRQRESPAVHELGLQIALEAQQEVALRTPVVGLVAGGIFEHAHAYVAEAPRTPARLSPAAGMSGRLHLAPVDGAERQV